MKILNNVYIKNTSVLSLDTTNTIAPANAGEMAWNQADGTLDLRLYNGTTLQSGQEIHIYGKASGNISNGDVVQFAGAQGDHILVKKAVGSEIKLHPEYIVGIATGDILNGNYGYITHFGKVHDLNTNAYDPGTVLYFDCATSSLITTVPVAPNPTIIMAAVLRQQLNEGSLLVRPRWSSSIKDLNDVHITDIQDGQVVSWNAANSRWENGSVSVAAEDVSIIDSGDYFTSAEVEGALQEAGNLLDNALYGSDPISGDPIPIDADTLDGHAASYFAVASHTHDDRYYTESESDALLNAKAPLASPTFTGTVSGVTKAMVGLGNVDNTSDVNKPISTATQTALDGKLSLIGGTLTGLLTTNGQIKFPATQNPSSDANTLDDYEEGTWTMTLNGTTPSSFTGYYTKIGRLVYCYAFTGTMTSTAVSANINGFPFTVAHGYPIIYTTHNNWTASNAQSGYLNTGGNGGHIVIDGTPGVLATAQAGTTYLMISIVYNTY